MPRRGVLRFITLTRILGVLLMVATAGTGYWLINSTTFAVEPPGGVGLDYVEPDAILAEAGLAPAGRPNAFTIRTSDIRNRLLADPAIADAQVSVVLPGRLIISLTERHPVFALKRPDNSDDYLVDANGLILATTGFGTVSMLGIPTIEDDRTQFAPEVQVGGQLDSIDLAAMLQLGALTPTLIDSGATSLALSVGDDKGYVLTASPEGWQAIFGEYTSTLRPTDLIPRQVQCLRSLLGASENDVHTIYLAPLDERCGTYLPVQTAHPSDTPNPSR